MTYIIHQIGINKIKTKTNLNKYIKYVNNW